MFECLKRTQRRKVLSIEENISIIKVPETHTGRVVVDRYRVAMNTISGIKMNCDKTPRFWGVWISEDPLQI